MSQSPDLIGSAQSKFIALSQSMFNALGILQRDATPILCKGNPTGDDGLQAVKQKLVDEILKESNDLDNYFSEIEMNFSEISNDACLVTTKLDEERISKQQSRIVELQERVTRLEDTFQEMMLARLRQ